MELNQNNLISELRNVKTFFPVFNPEPRILFYPSANINIGSFFILDYDVFVFSDFLPDMNFTKDHRREFWADISGQIKGPNEIPRPNVQILFESELVVCFRFGEKIGIYYFLDNNIVLKKITKSGQKIHCFVAICDGCSEGGNYECINDPRWLHNVFNLFPQNGGFYITDHPSDWVHDGNEFSQELEDRFRRNYPRTEKFNFQENRNNWKITLINETKDFNWESHFYHGYQRRIDNNRIKVYHVFPIRNNPLIPITLRIQQY